MNVSFDFNFIGKVVPPICIGGAILLFFLVLQLAAVILVGVAILALIIGRIGL